MGSAVVKLGGSTAYRAEMREWLDVLAGSPMPLVIVPGGGPFADQVRKAQAEMGFSDQVAHFMAILAMEQMGLALLDMNKRLAPARTVDEIGAVQGEGKLPVWLPSQMCDAAAEISQSWDVTSDSLAAWLAERIGAEALLLVKQTDAFEAINDIGELAAAGIVDAMLPSMLAPETELRLAGPGSLTNARDCFAAGRLPGTSFSAAVRKGAA
jgi:dihydroneopterin aldolase